ncbi:hypothetical protein CROQUDRAFT_135158 [Cronartium quercuum f. sp. fusiforme G11]|uniref:Calcineurin-like phosphoesterase domain-containing protein n=1 Tax=Cronartium quercuum f. sp. fusiforme G11 TaxID=708437 RepID=A0A9P6NF76_9BASI|nr:hypothetical protein CROQUDRAFT_135158 [Cronartium quercuum f. sp. fusiforme G11]
MNDPSYSSSKPHLSNSSLSSPSITNRTPTRIGLLTGLAASLTALLFILHTPSAHHLRTIIRHSPSTLSNILTVGWAYPFHHISSEALDWNQYVWHRQLEWNATSPGRLMAFGDVHGMGDSLKEMLRLLNYDPSSDTVLLVGDMAAKHPSIKASLKTLSYIRKSGFLAVRGNHDQDIIAWRNWMAAHRRSTGKDLNADESFEFLPEFATETPSKNLKHKLPKGWKWKSQHFEIARRLPEKDFKWLLSLSLTYHLPSLHTYFVHAGLLPWDEDQKTSILGSPRMTEKTGSSDNSILAVKENLNPQTLLEMRTVKSGRRVSSGKKGKAWYKIWNKAMDTCAEHVEDEEEVGADGKCGGPVNVVYGHWAAKGVKIKKWSTGLDGGCVYGDRLSALVIGGPVTMIPEVDAQQIDFQNQKATVVTMKCNKP